MNFVKVVFKRLLAGLSYARYQVVFISLILLTVSCKAPSYHGDNNLMKQIYRNQKNYYNTKLTSDKNDYISFINFGRKRREILYKKYDIDLSKQSLIVLEGFSPGWGNFSGLLISGKGNYNYRRNDEGIQKMELININSNDIAYKTGISKNIIDKVSAWDTSYIYGKRKQLGARVNDGFVFMATRVQYIEGNHTKIETITFKEWPD